MVPYRLACGLTWIEVLARVAKGERRKMHLGDMRQHSYQSLRFVRRGSGEIFGARQSFATEGRHDPASRRGTTSEVTIHSAAGRFAHLKLSMINHWSGGTRSNVVSPVPGPITSMYKRSG